MAGAGYKSFTTGDVLTASDLNTYGIEQTIMVFATSSARDTALSSAKAEGMFAFLKDSDALTYYDGSSWTTVDLAGDITGVTAGSGLAGGGSSGTVTLTVDTDAKGDLIVGTGADTATKLTAGTNTYVLTADSTTASGLIWSAPTTGDVTGVTAGSGLAGGGTSGTVTLTVDTDAKGDLIVGTGADTATKLTAGTNTYLLTADSSTTSGLSWTAPPTGDVTGVTAGTAMSGGGTSGAITVNVDVNSAGVATAVTSDYMLIADVTDSNATKKALISDVVSGGVTTGKAIAMSMVFG